MRLEQQSTPLALMVHGTAVKANISRDSTGPFAADYLDSADDLSTISMTEDDQKQILEELEIL